MGILDSLNPINLVKSAAESLVDSVLPGDLKAVGHDIVDAALDVASGNYGGLASDVTAFLHDAEQAMGPLASLGHAPSSPATEPDPPPPADPKKTSASSSSQTTEQTAPVTTPVVTAGDPATASSATTDAATPEPATATAGTSDSKSTEKTTSSTSKSTKKTTSSTSKSTASSDSKDITKFFAQSDTDLMAAVRDGKLPDAVRDDPAAMQRLQLRMNEIAEMNQLISQMLAAMHDMNKAVIQNIRA